MKKEKVIQVVACGGGVLTQLYFRAYLEIFGLFGLWSESMTEMVEQILSGMHVKRSRFVKEFGLFLHPLSDSWSR